MNTIVSKDIECERYRALFNETKGQYSMTSLGDDASASSNYSGLRPTIKSQRVHKPKINSDYVYSLDIHRKSTTKQARNGDEMENMTTMQSRVSAPKEEGYTKDQSKEKEPSIKTTHASYPDPRPISLTVNGKKIGRPRTRPYIPKEEQVIQVLQLVHIPKSNGHLGAAISVSKEAPKHREEEEMTPKSSKTSEYLSNPEIIDDDLTLELEDSFVDVEDTQDASVDENTSSIEENGRSKEAKKERKPTLMTYILQALAEHPDGMSNLADIYEYIRNVSDRYRYIKTEWRSSVRNCLSSSRRFKKHPRPISCAKQRGALWALNPDHPANTDLLKYPKDPSKFLSSDPIERIPAPRKSNGHIRPESPTLIIESLGGNSNLSTEDAIYQSHSLSATGQHPRNVRIEIVDNEMSKLNGYHQYSSDLQLNKPLSSASTDNQYVYYIPMVNSPLTTFSAKLESPSTQYEVPITTSSSLNYVNIFGGEFEEQQENWFPTPLVPKKIEIEESELKSLLNSVYTQL